MNCSCFFLFTKDTVAVGQILVVKIQMKETGIRIIMNGKMKILIQINDIHGKIIYHLQILIEIVHGMKATIIIIIIMGRQIMNNGKLPINHNPNNNKINNYLILKQTRRLSMRRQVVNTMYNTINIPMHCNKLCLLNNRVRRYHLNNNSI